MWGGVGRAPSCAAVTFIPSMHLSGGALLAQVLVVCKVVHVEDVGLDLIGRLS